MKNKNKNKALTLIELLLVISIIGLLTSIVLVGLQSARQKAEIAKALQWSQNIHSVLGVSIEGAWSFNEGGGTTVSDTSGNGNNGTLSGGVQFTTDTPNRKLGYALKFDGVDDYVDCGDVGNVKTISFWIKSNNLTTSILSLNAVQSISISNGTIQATKFTLPTIYVDTKKSSTIPDNNWHYILITQSSNISASAVYLGKVGTTNYFNGLLDEVHIYNKVLQTAEIQKHYARGLNSLLKKGLITKKDYETRLLAINN